MVNNSLNLPPDNTLSDLYESSNSNFALLSEKFKQCMPYVIVADDAFPLKTHMKSYAQRGLSYSKRIFNYRLSRARRTSENAFGILANVFRIFFTRMNVTTELASSITLACCILHKLLRTLSLESYTPRYSVDNVDDNGEITEGEWRNEGPSPYFTDLAPTQGRKAFY